MEILPSTGRVEYFTASKGYGFIKDADSGENTFSTSLPHLTPLPKETKSHLKLNAGRAGCRSTYINHKQTIIKKQER